MKRKRFSVEQIVGVLKQAEVGTTTYLYEGNTVKVTDPAGVWKKFYRDALGNLVQVDEPNPSGGTVSAYCTDNLRDQSTQVSMTRGSATQTRTFNYDMATGRLMSMTHPEAGAVSYTYNVDPPESQMQSKGETKARPNRVLRAELYSLSDWSQTSVRSTTATR